MLAVTTMNDAGALKTFLGKHFRRENFQSCVISIGLNIYYDTVCSEEIWSLTTAFRRWDNWSLKKVNALPKVIQLISG